MPVSTKPVEDDVDVASERQRVLRGDADNDMVKIENLTKVGPGRLGAGPGEGRGPGRSSGGLLSSHPLTSTRCTSRGRLAASSLWTACAWACVLASALASWVSTARARPAPSRC